MGPRTVELHWDDTSGNETEFRVAISRNGGATWDNVAVTAANATSVHVAGLEPNTRYLFKARAANPAGYSDYTNTVEFVTDSELPAAPSAPANLATGDIWARAA